MTSERDAGSAGPAGWPLLPPLREWEDTRATVHMWTQVVGKVRLSLAPWVNHSWGVALYVTTRGLTTSPIPQATRSFAIDFDFLDHALGITTSEGDVRTFALEPMPVADFFAKTTNALRELGVEASIYSKPVEVVDAIRFEEDRQHASYDAKAVYLYWRALVQAQRVLTEFRARFIGKVSPVHFFWGGFDLAVTRFSGRRAPKHLGGVPNCADWVMQEAYSHEVSSAGFWAGNGLGGTEEAAFYSYAYPQPAGFPSHPVPAPAYFHAALGEFVLPYESVRTADDPDGRLLGFLQSTYEGAAVLAEWDRAALERSGEPSRSSGVGTDPVRAG